VAILACCYATQVLTRHARSPSNQNAFAGKKRRLGGVEDKNLAVNLCVEERIATVDIHVLHYVMHKIVHPAFVSSQLPADVEAPLPPKCGVVLSQNLDVIEYAKNYFLVVVNITVQKYAAMETAGRALFLSESRPVHVGKLK
jgi:hypothetical protein